MVNGKVPSNIASAKPFYEFTSEPLSVFVNHMFKYSSNFAAEMVLKTIAASKNGQGSWEKGTEELLSWWQRCNLPGKLLIHNGSGMGNLNRFSPNQVVELLSYVNKQKAWSPEYVSALSIAGVDGTLKNRFRNSKLKGVVRAKTGTLNSYKVHTLAGYIFLSGKTYSFAIMCNNIGEGNMITGWYRKGYWTNSDLWLVKNCGSSKWLKKTPPWSGSPDQGGAIGFLWSIFQ